MTWYYKRLFNCDGKFILLLFICIECDFFNIGKRIELKQHARKDKSNGNYYNKSNGDFLNSRNS